LNGAAVLFLDDDLQRGLRDDGQVAAADDPIARERSDPRGWRGPGSID
jgi:hypothetical protein